MAIIKEEMHFTEENGISSGSVVLTFSEIPEILEFTAALTKFCRNVRAGGLQNLVKKDEPSTQPIKKERKHREKSEKPSSPMPKVASGRVSAWEYKFIKATADFEDLKRDYWRKFPKTVLDKQKLEEIWIYYHDKGQATRELEAPAPRTENDPKPGEQMGIGSKVVQVKGVSPAPGVGTVAEMKKDGSKCKVQFFNHIKVLPADHFALATAADINKARG